MHKVRKIVPTLFFVSWLCFVNVANAEEFRVIPAGELASQLYSYSLKIVGLAVFVMFLLAGLTYIVPGLKKSYGEPTQIIKDAVIGLVILVSAFVILNTISPDLVGNTLP